MAKKFLVPVTAFFAVLLLGAGCRGVFPGSELTYSDDIGSTSSGSEFCLSTDADAVGTVELAVAKVAPGTPDYSMWFAERAFVMGNAGEELCGVLPYTLMPGDEVLVNGTFAESKGLRWLVENRTPDASGSDNIREIWIDDQYYAVGKECGYVGNGETGFDVKCTIR